jgi:hypothetical protein
MERSDRRLRLASVLRLGLFALFGMKALFEPFVECQNIDMRFDDDANLLFEGLDRRHLVLARLIVLAGRLVCLLERCLQRRSAERLPS